MDALRRPQARIRNSGFQEAHLVNPGSPAVYDLAGAQRALFPGQVVAESGPGDTVILQHKACGFHVVGGVSAGLDRAFHRLDGHPRIIGEEIIVVAAALEAVGVEVRFEFKRGLPAKHLMPPAGRRAGE